MVSSVWDSNEERQGKRKEFDLYHNAISVYVRYPKRQNLEATATWASVIYWNDLHHQKITKLRNSFMNMDMKVNSMNNWSPHVASKFHRLQYPGYIYPIYKIWVSRFYSSVCCQSSILCTLLSSIDFVHTFVPFTPSSPLPPPLSLRSLIEWV